MTEFSIEYRARVYDDTHGYYVEVRPDSDGLGLCEIVYSDGDKDAKEVRICISWAMAELFASAVRRVSELRPENEA